MVPLRHQLIVCKTVPFGATFQKGTVLPYIFYTTLIWCSMGVGVGVSCTICTKRQHLTLLSHLESSIFSLYLPSTPNWLAGELWEISVENLEDMHDSKWDKRVDSCFLVMAKMIITSGLRWLFWERILKLLFLWTVRCILHQIDIKFYPFN